MASRQSLQPRLLLHVCCGSCATAVVERLLPRFEVELLWYNPNIQPPAEHQQRYQGVRQVAKHFGVRLRAIEPDEARWLQAVAGLEDEPEGGRRCTVCFDYRLRRAAQVAGREGFDYLATTLTISPLKDLERVNRLGAHQAERCGVQFLTEDFRKAGGVQRSVELSKELGLYRQNYCGCLFALQAQLQKRASEH